SGWACTCIRRNPARGEEDMAPSLGRAPSAPAPPPGPAPPRGRMGGVSVDLADRYGKKRRPSRLQVGALVVVCAALLGWLVWAALPYFSPTVSSQEIGWKVVDQHTVEVRARVDVADDAEGVSCRVKALAADKSVVGEERF